MTAFGRPAASALPDAAGAGLRHPHVASFLNERPPVAWLEVHSENYMGPGGPRLAALIDLRADYPVSCHGVGLSLGSAQGIDADHLDRLARLVERVEPAAVSEHVSWSVVDGVYLNDLLPLPYTEEALAVLACAVGQVQDRLKRPILVENPSRYGRLADSLIPEPEFLAELARRSGCGILLDVNNIHVSTTNLGEDAVAWLDALPTGIVGEIHVAGHLATELAGHRLLLDDHGSAVPDPVWALLDHALARFGARPVLVEWDTLIPPLPVLLDQVTRAQRHLDACRTTGAADAA